MAKQTTVETSTMNIYEKIAAVRRMTEVMRKDKSGYNYKYVAEDTILAHVAAGLDKYRLMYFPRIEPGTVEILPYEYIEKKQGRGNAPAVETTVHEFCVSGQMVYTWVNLDKPEETFEVPWFFAGEQSNVSQAMGSGLTYLNRYFLLKFFGIATPDDDPDNWRNKKNQVSDDDDAEIVKATVEEIGAMVSDMMSQCSNDDENKMVHDALAGMIKKYAKDQKGKPSADYRRIKSAKDAAALLAELQEFKNASDKGEKA